MASLYCMSLVHIMASGFCCNSELIASSQFIGEECYGINDG